MKFLIDTNIIIAAEPTSSGDIEHNTEAVALLIRSIRSYNYDIFIHPASYIDIEKDTDNNRKKMRKILLNKYPKLQNPPEIDDDINNTLGIVEKDTSDYVDHLLLTAVYRDAIDYLITEDRDILKKSHRLGIQDRVLMLDFALRMLRGLHPQDIEPPPAVKRVFCYQLDENDAIFDSFKKDYPGFETWLKKCKREHRNAWLIRDSCGKYVGVSIVKSENEREDGLLGRILKICSFKITDKAIGKGYSIANFYSRRF